MSTDMLFPAEHRHFVLSSSSPPITAPPLLLASEVLAADQGLTSNLSGIHNTEKAIPRAPLTMNT